MKKRDIEEIGLSGFPPIQTQRWNSIFLTLNYVIKNIDGITQILDSDSTPLLVMDNSIDLRNDLEPVYDFTTLCEKGNANQADLYINYRSLKAKLKVKALKSPRANRLLELIKIRFNSTADIKIAKLCYFLSNAGICEKHERFPHVTSDEVLKDCEKKAFDKEVAFFEKFSDTLDYICQKIDLDKTIVFNSFETLLKYYHPDDKNIYNFPRARNIRSLMMKYSGDLDRYIILSQFIEILQTLPASESAAERIFARMRDLIDSKQTRLSAKSLRSQIILSFYADQNRAEFSE